MLAVLTVVQTLQCAAGMFFHEPSSVVIQGLEAENNSDFGFAMAYRNETKTLVVGAPKADFIGKVFICQMKEAEDVENIECGEQFIDFEPSDYNIERFPKQRFHMGSSIVATNKYFFTCAPLWTTKIKAIDRSGKVSKTDVFGTCFSQDEYTNRYQGLLEYYLKSNARKKGFIPVRRMLNVERFNGGTGWSTLVDEENDLLLIAKSSLNGDFLFVPATEPTSDVKSLADKDIYAHYLPQFWNIGFGITAGKFFSNHTVYAFSMLTKTMEGKISFLEYYKPARRLSMLALSKMDERYHKFIMLNSKVVGTMFGTTMSAADLNMDGRDELLVGAPVQSQDECFECGALHIYTGGDMKTINEANRLRSIFGVTAFGRFGSAIAIKDIDGDGKKELVVSAPYENHGRGAIYILSGYEIYHTLMKTLDYKGVQVSDLKLTQRIQKEDHRTLGFSLQFINDVDRNGCDDLAAGSPGSSNVLLFKCVQKINVTLFSHLIGEQMVREQDTNFTVQVCARVQLPNLPKDIVGELVIENSIIGEAAIIKQPSIIIDISCYNCERDRKGLCENVTVELGDKEPRYYTFISNATLQNDYLYDENMIVFNNTWVETSPYSKMNRSMEVSRHCKGDDCIPKLSLTLNWTGSDRYLLGSSANETLKIKVRNDGNASHSGCFWLRVTGAPLTQVGCSNYKKGYTCYLPKPLRRDSDYYIDMVLNMTTPKNTEESLRVQVFLYKNCNQESDNSSISLEIPFDLSSDGVFNDGDTHSLNITDTQIMEKATVYDHYEYLIRNNGSITWEKVIFTVMMEKKPYINSFSISASDFGECEKKNTEVPEFITHHCNLTLMPNATLKIIGTTEILAGHLSVYPNGAELNISSPSELFLSDRVSKLPAISITKITIIKEMTLSTNKTRIALIAGLVALIILAILTLILYKCGFFRRKQKQKLLVMQDSVRRASVRRNTHVSVKDGLSEGLQMDVDDDSPFDEPQPVTHKDNIGFVLDEEEKVCS